MVRIDLVTSHAALLLLEMETIAPFYPVLLKLHIVFPHIQKSEYIVIYFEYSNIYFIPESQITPSDTYFLISRELIYIISM